LIFDGSSGLYCGEWLSFGGNDCPGDQERDREKKRERKRQLQISIFLNSLGKGLQL
jgi:hypothetical protein